MTTSLPNCTWTRRTVLDDLVARFSDAGLDSPLADARLLIAHVLRIDRLKLHTASSEVMTAAERDRIELCAERRLAHEPVSRIIGERWFFGRPFRVTPATLDPRPDTETIIDAAKSLFAEANTGPTRILDIGTGTGCILLTLLAEFPDARGVGTDVSAGALEIAEANAIDLGLTGRADFKLGADFAPAAGEFDLVVSNPPYIPTSEIPHLDPEVRNFDPPIALDGGADGLDVYRRLVAQYSSVLSAGWLILEVGHNQAPVVAELFRTAMGRSASLEIRTFKDLGGVTRCVAICPRPVATR